LTLVSWPFALTATVCALQLMGNFAPAFTTSMKLTLGRPLDPVRVIENCSSYSIKL
jgi:hypothetical protein